MSAPAALGSQKTGGPRTPPASGLSWLPCAIAAFVAEVAVIYLIGSSPEGRAWVPVLLFAAHLLLVPFLIRNLSFWGARMILVGLGLNLIVMAANGGLMPVAPSAVEAIGKHDLRELPLGDPIPGSKNVLLEPDQTHAQLLSDVIVLPIPRPYRRAVSLGDLVVFGGVAATFVEVTRRYRQTRPAR
jgi:hypothetical protein